MTTIRFDKKKKHCYIQLNFKEKNSITLFLITPNLFTRNFWSKLYFSLDTVFTYLTKLANFS